jgi:hypothetical protein
LNRPKKKELRSKALKKQDKSNSRDFKLKKLLKRLKLNKKNKNTWLHKLFRKLSKLPQEEPLPRQTLPD